MHVLGDCDLEDIQACMQLLDDYDTDGILDHRVLGDFFFKGTYPLKRDPELAFRLYSMAENDPSALCSMGLMYENGIGVQQSIPDAARCYGKAFELSSERAEWLLTSLCIRCGDSSPLL